eukprot:5661909-Amphidinium_carterae.1
MVIEDLGVILFQAGMVLCVKDADGDARCATTSLSSTYRIYKWMPSGDMEALMSRQAEVLLGDSGGTEQELTRYSVEPKR